MNYVLCIVALCSVLSVNCFPQVSRKPAYIECVSSSECSFDSCCVLGNYHIFFAFTINDVIISPTNRMIYVHRNGTIQHTPMQQKTRTSYALSSIFRRIHQYNGDLPGWRSRRIEWCSHVDVPLRRWSRLRSSIGPLPGFRQHGSDQRITRREQSVFVYRPRLIFRYLPRYTAENYLRNFQHSRINALEHDNFHFDETSKKLKFPIQNHSKRI